MRSGTGNAEAAEGAAARLRAGAAALSFSVLADSSLDHYRGGFYDPVMFVAPTVAALTLGATVRRGAGRRGQQRIYQAAAATGVIGAGFHTYNVAKREGGFRWENLFYGAPLAAPFGITFAGLMGLAAEHISSQKGTGKSPRLLGRPAGPVLALGTIAGLLGTAAEAGLLHFRGAFHDPFMYVPVTLPPLAAAALGVTALRPSRRARRRTRSLLRATATAGLAGMAFHAYGIHRNMGGWRNWSQMIQQGPPLPAPPSFTGMALAGLAALRLLKGAARA